MPYGSYLLLPFFYLNTHIHELLHALTAIGTGGRVGRMEVYANGSGVTYISGGFALLVSSAGYVGCAIVGAVLLRLARDGGATRIALMILAGLLGIELVAFLRGDLVGLGTAIFWAAALIAALRLQSDRTIGYIVAFLGAALTLNAFSSLGALFTITVSSDGGSDARNMEAITHIPAIFWSVLWAIIAAILFVVALRPGRKSP